MIDERPLLSPHHQDQYGNSNSSSYGNRNYEAQYKGNTDYYAKDAAESERKYFVDFALQVVQKRLVTILEVILRRRRVSSTASDVSILANLHSIHGYHIAAA